MSTIKEVAELAGVSSATVSHVINGTRFVSEAVREQVLQAMNSLNYQPNALARSLRSGHTHTLGLILPDSANPFFAEMGHSIEMAAFEAGYSVIFCNTENDIERESFYLDVLTKKQVDGIIFVSTGENKESLKKLIELKIPTVVLDRDLAGMQMDFVQADNLQGGYLATRYLISLGHKRIGCIAGSPKVAAGSQRMTGYQKACEEFSIPVDGNLVAYGEFNPVSGWELGLRMLSQKDRPTAIFVSNDMMAIGVLRAAAELSISVPNDLAIVGFDDIELASYTIPPLTTIKQPKVEMGKATLDLILRRISDELAEPKRIVLPVSLVIRSSCGSQNHINC
jgi:LacI family transcriptional regulator